MIYLIDDNQFSQREKFLPDISSGEYRLKLISKIPKTGDMTYVDHLKFLADADCILLHKSMEDVDEVGNYISGSTTNSNKIIHDIAQYGDKIPLVVFTGGASNSIVFDPNNPNLVEELQKSKFYKRLIPFLESYKKSGKIDLSKFLHGKNAETEKLKILADTILAGFRYSDENEMVKLDDLPQDDFRKFIQISKAKTNYSDVIRNWKKKPITVKQLKKRINQLLEESDG